MAKKAKAKAGGKSKEKPAKDGKKKVSKKASKDTKEKETDVEVPSGPPPPDPFVPHVKISFCMAAFHKTPALPCHFSKVYTTGTPVAQILFDINTEKFGGTARELHLFKGFLRAGEVVMEESGSVDPDWLVADLLRAAWLEEKPVDGKPFHGKSLADATSGPSSLNMYYDYRPVYSDSLIVNQDEYFVNKVPN